MRVSSTASAFVGDGEAAGVSDGADQLCPRFGEGDGEVETVPGMLRAYQRESEDLSALPC